MLVSNGCKKEPGARERLARGEGVSAPLACLSRERPVLSCAHYFQAAPAMQVNLMTICNFYLFSMVHHLDARMRTATVRTGRRNGKITFFLLYFLVLCGSKRVDLFIGSWCQK